MKKGYAFSPDEFIPVHPVDATSIHSEVHQCIEVLDLIGDYSFLCSNNSQPPTGLYQALTMLSCRLEAVCKRITPESLAVVSTKRMENLPKNVSVLPFPQSS